MILDIDQDMTATGGSWYLNYFCPHRINQMPVQIAADRLSSKWNSTSEIMLLQSLGNGRDWSALGMYRVESHFLAKRQTVCVAMSI